MGEKESKLKYSNKLIDDFANTMVENNNYSYRNKFYYFKLDDYNLYIALMSYSSMIKLSKKLIKNSRIMGIKLVEVKM